MGWIHLHPTDYEESQRSVKHLHATEEWIFDLIKNGAQLRPLAFGYRICTKFERKYHSVVEEKYVVDGKFSKIYIFYGDSIFSWLCYCAEIKEILEYEGSFPMIFRLVQELLGYPFFYFAPTLKNDDICQHFD